MSHKQNRHFRYALILFSDIMIFCALYNCSFVLSKTWKAKYRMVHVTAASKCLVSHKKKFNHIMASLKHWFFMTFAIFKSLGIMKWNMKCGTAACIYFITILSCICKQGTRPIFDLIKDLTLKELGFPL